MEDPRNFRVITSVRTSGGKLKVWDFVAATKESFPELGIAQVELPELKKMSKLCSRRAPVFFHPSLSRVIKLTFLTDGNRIVNDRWAWAQISLDSSSGSRLPQIFIHFVTSY